MKRNWTEEQKEFIINCYTKQGLTCTEIGRKFGAKPDTISKYLKEWGIEIKGNKTKNRLLREDYFSIIDCPEKAYFLGLLFADGSIALDDKRAPSLRLELVESDVDILKTFLNRVNSQASLKYDKRKNRKNGTFSFSIRSQKLVNDLSKYNIVPNKTYVVDDVVIPKDYEIDYLRGFIDGDGSIYQESNGKWHMNICGHSLNIISQLSILGNQLIGKEGSGYISCYDNVYRHTWSQSDTFKLLDVLYNNDRISITRKRLKAMAALEDKKS